MPRSRVQRWALYLVVAYCLLLLISALVRYRSRAVPDARPEKRVEVHVVTGSSIGDRMVSMAYEEYTPVHAEATLPVLMIHGSPGRGADFERVAPLLNWKRRIIAPDLPGFGRSTHEIPDYSIQAHALYLLQLLDALAIERVHVVGFSMGGGVALQLDQLAPRRVASLTMLSAIGVQEMELLGDYHLNHLIHGLQLGLLWGLRELTPHFGLFDNSMLGIEYARNFFDTDQRPLREMLRRYQGPMLIIHGKRDVLVPIEAAIEHHRIVPQSELVVTEQDHFMVFLNPSVPAPNLDPFFARVEAGAATTRATSDPRRIAEAAKPFDPSAVPKAIGVTAFVVFILLAAATLVSEDLTCISGGLMAAQGRAGFLLVTSACLSGIFVGDILLFLAGRFLGRPALRRAPLRWFVGREAVDRSSAWFARRGAAVIFLSRFMPGLRLPTYFAAGVLNTSFLWFSVYFFAACLVWTPLLVGLSMLFGAELVKWLLVEEGSVLFRFAVLAGFLFLSMKLATRLATARGRRLMLSRWRRIRHWEFWPRWLFYPPVVLYVAWLALRYRSLTLFTLANPAIPAGGFIGESKSGILAGLSRAAPSLARYRVISADDREVERIRLARDFMRRESIGFPVVLKPDVGQRGDGVAIVKTDHQLVGLVSEMQGDSILQEFIGGREYGVFYYRYPDEDRGHILAITDKRFPALAGDGKSTLERLILEDDRTVSMAKMFLKQEESRLEWIPAMEESVQLVELGTHCRGSVFLDGTHLKTPELEAAIDTISRSFDGFYFGRYDIRTPSEDDLRAGRNLRVIELNGVTSEATSIYDPENSLWSAYRVLFRQWTIAFEIGSQNRKRGIKPATLRELTGWMRSYQRRSRRRNGSLDQET